MAKSKVRKKAVYTPPQKSKAPEVSPRWLVPTMTDLHNWNLGIGFAAIILGVILSTRWR